MATSGLPAYLKKRRKAMGNITQADLAELMGPDAETNYVTQLETGRVKIPQQPYLGMLASALGVSEIEILRQAGLIQEPSRTGRSEEDDPVLTVVMSGAKRLTDKGKEMLADYVQSLQKFEGRPPRGKDRQ